MTTKLMASYHDELKALAESIGSDGCTHALEIDTVCCWEHDYTCVSGYSPRGVPMTKAEANQRFRDCIQARSPLGYLSPLSWWRWLGVTAGARGIWAQRAKRRPLGFLADPATTAALLEARATRAAIITEIVSR